MQNLLKVFQQCQNSKPLKVLCLEVVKRKFQSLFTFLISIISGKYYKLSLIDLHKYKWFWIYSRMSVLYIFAEKCAMISGILLRFRQCLVDRKFYLASTLKITKKYFGMKVKIENQQMFIKFHPSKNFEVGFQFVEV